MGKEVKAEILGKKGQWQGPLVQRPLFICLFRLSDLCTTKVADMDESMGRGLERSYCVVRYEGLIILSLFNTALNGHFKSLVPALTCLQSVRK